MNRREFVEIMGVSSVGLGLAPSAFSIFKKRSDEEICKSAWEQLCGNIGKVYKTDAFTYVHPEKRKPNVLIYGDSISIMYSSMVRKCLKDQATLIRLFKNGGSSHDFISNMDKMHQSMFQPHLEKGWNFKWDVIHFNVGLHDLKYLKGRNLNKKNGKQVSTLEEYKSNLEEICHYLKHRFPKAKLIFATTTPVPENSKGRFAGDSVKFNKAAKEVLDKFPDIHINDLYAFTLPHHEAWAQEPGNVHYNELGYTQQGTEVARIIAKYL